MTTANTIAARYEQIKIIPIFRHIGRTDIFGVLQILVINVCPAMKRLKSLLQSEGPRPSDCQEGQQPWSGVGEEGYKVKEGTFGGQI